MRFKTITIIFLYVLAIALLVGCNKDATGPGDGEDESTPFVFPHADGSEWVYLNEGWKGGEAINETIIILNGYTQHPIWGNVQNLEEWYYDDQESEWEYSHTVYMKVTETEVRYYDRDQDGSEEIFLKFPIKVGDNWVFNEDRNWDAIVLAQGDITVPAGTFEDCYIIKYEERYGIDGSSYEIWYASGVGGFYGIKKTQGGLSSRKKLLEYTLPSR